MSEIATDGLDWAKNGFQVQGDPIAWLTQTLGRIANQWPSAEIDAFLPGNYCP